MVVKLSIVLRYFLFSWHVFLPFFLSLFLLLVILFSVWFCKQPALAVIETTIGNSNPALYKYVQPNTVLEWIRNILANRLASDAKTWQEVETVA